MIDEDIVQSLCRIRGCKHYEKLTQDDGRETTERYICQAYPQGIPDEITVGIDMHWKPRKDQDNEIVFEPKEQ